MRVLVTGGAGMLGSAVVPALLGAGHDVMVTDVRDGGRVAGRPVERLDVRSGADIERWVGRARPDLVVHLAALTNLEACQANPDDAHAINSAGTKRLAEACQRAGATLAYVSTAGVFDGSKTDGPYTEADTPRPINVYGTTKYEGELWVRSIVPDHYVVRAGWMMGGGPALDHKFVGMVLSQLAAGSRTLYAVTDKLGSPTYAADQSRCLVELVASRRYGLYHLVGEGEATRYAVARHILDVLDRCDVELVAVDSTFFGAWFSTIRPRSEVLRNDALEAAGLNRMRPWRVALAEYLRAEYGHLAAITR